MTHHSADVCLARLLEAADDRQGFQYEVPTDHKPTHAPQHALNPVTVSSFRENYAESTETCRYHPFGKTFDEFSEQSRKLAPPGSCDYEHSNCDGKYDAMPNSPALHLACTTYFDHNCAVQQTFNSHSNFIDFPKSSLTHLPSLEPESYRDLFSSTRGQSQVGNNSLSIVESAFSPSLTSNIHLSLKDFCQDHSNFVQDDCINSEVACKCTRKYFIPNYRDHLVVSGLHDDSRGHSFPIEEAPTLDVLAGYNLESFSSGMDTRTSHGGRLHNVSECKWIKPLNGCEAISITDENHVNRSALSYGALPSLNDDKHRLPAYNDIYHSFEFLSAFSHFLIPPQRSKPALSLLPEDLNSTNIQTQLCENVSSNSAMQTDNLKLDISMDSVGQNSFQDDVNECVFSEDNTNYEISKHSSAKSERDLGSYAEDNAVSELRNFAVAFKQRRMKLGITQAEVGRALGHLKLGGFGCLSQSTICRFESLTLSHNNMLVLKPILQNWLHYVERHQVRGSVDQTGNPALSPRIGYYAYGVERKRRRTSITDSEKRVLEVYFRQQPKPTSEQLGIIASNINLRKSVVRVWFCNQRQKQKRMQGKQGAYQANVKTTFTA